MKVSRMLCLEVVRHKKLLETFEIIAVVEFQDPIDTGARTPDESDSRKFLNILKSVALELEIGLLLCGKKVCYAAHIERDLLEYNAWGAVDIMRSDRKTLVAIYDNNALTAKERERLRREVFPGLAKYFQIKFKIDWNYWGGEVRVFSDVERKLIQ